ncbi:MAG: PKD domain-containing protein [Acidobacteriota bacterium]
MRNLTIIAWLIGLVLLSTAAGAAGDRSSRVDLANGSHSGPETMTDHQVYFPFFPPTACFTVSPRFGPAPLVVRVDASCSSDFNGFISSYRWTMGDGTIRTGRRLSQVYTRWGYYTITLTVTDNSGLSRSTSFPIHVHGSGGGHSGSGGNSDGGQGSEGPEP